MLAAIALGAYFWALANYGEGKHSRTITLMVLVGVQIGHLFNCRSQTRSAFNNFFGNPFIFIAMGIVLCLQILALYFPPLVQALDTTPLKKADFLVIGISVILPVLIIETQKLVSRKTSNDLEHVREKNI